MDYSEQQMDQCMYINAVNKAGCEDLTAEEALGINVLLSVQQYAKHMSLDLLRMSYDELVGFWLQMVRNIGR